MPWAQSRSCRAPRSIADCARSSGVWPAERLPLGAARLAPPVYMPPVKAARKSLSGDLRGWRVVGLAGVLHRGDEVVELVAREAALAAGCPVAVDVAGVGPAA